MSMISAKNVEKLEDSAVKLTVTVAADAVKKVYEDLLKKYSKSLHIKGFRKGKVPASVLEQKFGDSLKGEASFNVVEEALKEAFDTVEEKPLPYAQPELLDEESLSLDVDKELTFSVKYDVFPEFKLEGYKGLEISQADVKVLKKDIDRELAEIRDQNAMVMDKPDGKATKNTIVTVDYVELDESDNEIEGTKREGFVFTMGQEQNLYKFDSDVSGMKKGSEKIFEKTFAEDFDDEQLAGKTVKLKVNVTAVKKKDLPALDDELAQDVNEKFETLEDLKADIKKRLTDNLEAKRKEQNLDAVMAKIQEATEVPVPEAMLKMELDNSWHRFIQQSYMPEEQILNFLSMQGKTKEDLFEEWKPAAIKSIKSQLILGQIQETEKIEPTDEEVDAELAKQAEAMGQDLEEVKKMFDNDQMKEYLKSEVRNRKVVDFLLEKTKISKGDKVDYLDFIQNNGQ